MSDQPPAEVIEHKKALSTRQFRLSLALSLVLVLGPLALDLSPIAYPGGYLSHAPIPLGIVWLYLTIQLDALYVDEHGNLHPRKLRVEKREERDEQ